MSNGTADATRLALERLFAAIEGRDLLAIESALSVDATWQNVPHPASVGRQAVLRMLAPILRWSDEVRWDISSASYEPGLARIERSDRFVVNGVEHAIACHGAFGVDADGLVTCVRDYADLAEWRHRITPVYAAMRSRPAIDVVGRHIAAAAKRDAVAMSLDYALDAVLIRDGREYAGYRAIAEYFAGVPARLKGRDLALSQPTPTSAHEVEVRWAIDSVVSGVDRYVVQEGWIQHQEVTLDGPDF